MQVSGGEGSVEMNALGAEKASPSFTSAEGSVAEEEGGVQPSMLSNADPLVAAVKRTCFVPAVHAAPTCFWHGSMATYARLPLCV